MSRWGALFADLSRDTIDTIAKTPAEGATAPLCVDCVDCVQEGVGNESEGPAVLHEPAPLDHDAGEAAAMVAFYAAEGAARPYQPGAPDPLRDGLLLGALQRPPAWSDPSLIPPPGAWCSCCGRFDRKGGRWWTAAPEPDGWACVTCHPPLHLKPEAIKVVTT